MTVVVGIDDRLFAKVTANADVKNSIILVHPTCGPTQPGDIDGPTRHLATGTSSCCFSLLVGRLILVLFWWIWGEQTPDFSGCWVFVLKCCGNFGDFCWLQHSEVRDILRSCLFYNSKVVEAFLQHHSLVVKPLIWIRMIRSIYERVFSWHLSQVT